MFWVHLLIVIAFIVIGSRLGGIGIGLAGGAGVLVLAATGVHTDSTKAHSVVGHRDHHDRHLRRRRHGARRRN